MVTLAQKALRRRAWEDGQGSLMTSEPRTLIQSGFGYLKRYSCESGHLFDAPAISKPSLEVDMFGREDVVSYCLCPECQTDMIGPAEHNYSFRRVR